MDSRWDAGWQAANPAIVDLMRARSAAARDDAPKPRPAPAASSRPAPRHDTYARLPQLTMPTLVCAGRYDGIAPLANAEALAAQIPGATLQVFDGGHALPPAGPERGRHRRFLADGQPSTRPARFLSYAAVLRTADYDRSRPSVVRARRRTARTSAGTA